MKSYKFVERPCLKVREDRQGSCQKLLFALAK